MDAITEHHYKNIADGKSVENEDGTVSTVRTIIVEIDGVETLIPTVWDGQVVDQDTAVKFAKDSGVEWPRRTGETAVQELEEFDAEIHQSMTDTTSPEEASQILQSEYANKYALGGLATSQKGITTQEGLDMANNRFQLDQKKADLDKDGKLSDYEMARGEAIQKANADDPENEEKMQMYHGGMACGCEGECDGSCGGMMSDPVSGNPIPMGSSAENVRDDIEAMISEGEYVLPANVVKWHGLKHIMDMQSEAEMGLMGMFSMGLIQYASEEEAEEPEEVDEAEDDVPSENVDIEVAAVEVDDMLDDDEEVEEVYPKTSKLPGMMNTPKMVFMS